MNYDELFPNAYKSVDGTSPAQVVRTALKLLAREEGPAGQNAQRLLDDPDWVIYYP